MNTLSNRKILKRLDFPNHVHELTFSCYKSRHFLTSEKTCTLLANTINKVCLKLNYGIIAYVFMPNHVHLVVIPYEINYSISEFLKAVKQPVGRKEVSYAKQYDSERLQYFLTGWDSPKHAFWNRGAGYDRNITNEKTLVFAVEYIHNNPVRKGLAPDVYEWKWSSAKALLLNEEGPIPVVKGYVMKKN